MIEIDGSYGEGGGQIIREAIALSLITQKAFRAKNIRKGRDNPGLKDQHIAAIKSVQESTKSAAEGCEKGSKELTFYPKPFKGGRVDLKIETAGSITLAIQALLLP